MQVSVGSYRRGIALITSLLLSVLFLVIVLGFMAFMERDYLFAGHMNRSTQAYYLAESGLDYYRLRSGSFSAGVVQRFDIPPEDPRNHFEVVVLSDGTIRSTGIVTNNAGDVLNTRTLVVPMGNYAEVYDESQ